MKKALLLFSFMLTILFSQTVAQIALEYVEPSETYILTKITSGGNNYWIVNIEGEDTLIIDSTPSLITSESQISDILITKFKEESMINYKKEQTRDFILQFNQSQYPDRKTCEQYTGVNKMPCFDKESCLKACFAVPICSMVKSEPFILTILDWNNKKITMDEELSNVLSKLENADSSSEYAGVRNSIKSLKTKMEDLESNGLYDVYGFCKDMNISYISLTSANNLILEIENSLINENTIQNKANNIYKLTTERVNFVQERSDLYNEAYMKIYNAFKECEDNYKKSNVYDSDVELKLATASTYTNDMMEIKNEGNYRIAINKSNEYYSKLLSLKTTINNLSIQRKEVNIEANKTIELLKKSYPTLKNTKYYSNFTFIREEVEKVLVMRIVSSDLLNTKEKMVEYNEQVKEMVSDCVLNGCDIIEEEIENETNETNETNEPEIEIPDELNETDDEIIEEEEDVIDTRPPQPLEIISQQISRVINFVKRNLCAYLGIC